MSQVVGYPGSGIRLGTNFALFVGAGDPASSTAPDVVGANLNSAYIRLDAPDSSHWLYRCTASGIYTNGVLTTPAQWSAH